MLHANRVTQAESIGALLDRIKEEWLKRFRSATHCILSHKCNRQVLAGRKFNGLDRSNGEVYRGPNLLHIVESDSFEKRARTFMARPTFWLISTIGRISLICPRSAHRGHLHPFIDNVLDEHFSRRHQRLRPAPKTNSWHECSIST